ncbi:MAG: hypothetical protein CMH64_01890 [Nanoarchaeota archaeon]|nr:hypothetical protein [Nanoarchaeota archaeon]|tara:strand:- start:4192 stop:4629 length:438 start_codon:yes stop_codon:yes gene_type:complete
MEVSYKDQTLKGEKKSVVWLTDALRVMKDCGTTSGGLYVVDPFFRNPEHYFMMYHGHLTRSAEDSRIERPIDPREEVEQFLSELWGKVSSGEPFVRLEDKNGAKPFYEVEIHALVKGTFSKELKKTLKSASVSYDNYRPRIHKFS